jgi:hypothetical protein
MLGWFSRASACASRWKRSAKRASSVRSGARIFQRDETIELWLPHFEDRAHSARADE